MKYIYITILLLFITITQTFAIDFYQGDYQAALVMAKREDKNVLLYFTATWCGPCQYMQQNIFPDKTITDYVNAHYIALKIDIDSETGKRLYFKFEHQGVPDFYILSPDELILKRKIGGMKVGQLKSFLAIEQVTASAVPVLSDSLAAIRQSSEDKQTLEMLAVNPKIVAAFAHKKAKSDSVANLAYANMMARKKTGLTGFYFNAMLSKWKPGISIGANLNSFRGNVSGNAVLPGYQVGFLLNYTQPKFYIQPELQLLLKGGAQAGVNYRLRDIELPITLGYRIGWHRLIDGKQAIWLNIAPYAGYSLSGKSALSPAVVDLNRWNYGLKGGLSLSMGSFIPSLGYDLGLADLDKSGAVKVSTRSYYVSFALIIGK